MIWWLYIIVWVGSWSFSLMIANLMLDPGKEQSEEPKLSTRQIIHQGTIRFLLACIFATLNCIFCAILFGLK